MPDGQVLEFTRVTKRFNDVTAVSDLSARVEPGVVTAFLGPNGAGKTTSLRILLGQVRPTSGTATIGGVAYSELRHPLRTIGSVLEETAYRPRRSASRHLTIAAKANGIPLSRVDEVLALVGLDHEAEGRVGSFSLGMRQRLSVAHALLGDPGALVFDEPANGLDPEGIRWMRLLMRRLADEGRTVLVSSHVLSEIEQVADHVLVLSKGQLVLSSGIETLADPSGGSVVVDSADRVGLRSALATAGFEVEVLRSGLRVRGGDAQTVGAIAASAGVALSTLVQRGPTLEDVFIELVRGGTLGPRAVAAASAYVEPQEAAAAPVEAPAAADADADAPVEAPAAADADADAPVGAPAAADADADAPVDAHAPVGVSNGTTEPGAAIGPAEGADETAFSPVGAVDAGPAQTSVGDTEAAPPAVGDADAALDTARAVGPSAGEAADAPTPEGVDADSRAESTTIIRGDQDADSAEPQGDAEADSAEDGATEGAPAEAEAPSFDDILFGTGGASEHTDDDQPAAHADARATDDGAADASGVEIFDDLGEADDEVDQRDESVDADPRSAAVTTMLAAAARAYYEDEPADYPLGDAGSQTSGADDEGNADDGAADDGAHWSVASTGVIDQVPAWTPGGDSAPADEGGHGEVAGEGEHHEGEQHDGEQHHDGEHHEHHDGERHEQHDGEHQEQHEGEHQEQHEGERHEHPGHRED